MNLDLRRRLRAALIGVGSLVDLDGRATRQCAVEAAGQHLFFDVCEHGTHLLNECLDCPDGCPVIPGQDKGR